VPKMMVRLRRIIFNESALRDCTSLVSHLLLKKVEY
jgi:hypothetical protein